MPRTINMTIMQMQSLSSALLEHAQTACTTPQEDRILIDGHRKYGNKWTEIAKLVGGRTDNAVKNRWAALSKRTQKISSRTVASRGRKPRAKKYEEDEETTEEEPELDLPPRHGYHPAQPPMQMMPPLQHAHMGHMGLGGHLGQAGMMGPVGRMPVGPPMGLPPHGAYGRLPSPRTSPRLAALHQGANRVPANYSQGPSVYLPASMKRGPAAQGPSVYAPDPYAAAAPPAKRQAVSNGRGGVMPGPLGPCPVPVAGAVPLGHNHMLRNHVSPFPAPGVSSPPAVAAQAGPSGLVQGRGLSGSPAPPSVSPPGAEADGKEVCSKEGGVCCGHAAGLGWYCCPGPRCM